MEGVESRIEKLKGGLKFLLWSGIERLGFGLKSEGSGLGIEGFASGFKSEAVEL